MSGGASWRVALRIARRDARRARARTALVAVLIALPVGAATVADVVWNSQQPDARDVVELTLGTTQAEVQYLDTRGPLVQNPEGSNYRGPGGSDITVSPRDPAEVDATVTRLLPAGNRLVTAHQWGPEQPLRVGDVAVRVMISDEAYAGPDLVGRVRQVSGRAPSAPGEAAISPTLADATGLRLGDRATLPTTTGGTTAVTVVGIAHPREETSRYGSNLVYAAPGTLPTAGPRDGSSWTTMRWIVGGTPVTWDDVRRFNEQGFVVRSRAVLLDPPPDSEVDPSLTDANLRAKAEAAAYGALVSGLVLLQVCFMAGPALAVGARRQHRTLALVAANGGRRADSRRLVLSGGVVTGAVAAAIGVTLGSLTGAGTVVWVQQTGRSVMPRVDLRPLELAGLALVAVLAALVAAAVPAWQAGRRDVVTALRGGAAPGRVNVPLALTGVVAALAGGAGVAAGAAAGNDLLILATLVVLEIGLLLIVPTVVALSARLAGRAPLPLRMAMRDADRHRSRTVPAVAATMAAVAGAVAALMVTSATRDSDAAWWTYTAAPGRALAVGNPVAQAADPANGIPPLAASDPQRLAALLARTLPVSGTWAPLGTAVTADGTRTEINVVQPNGCEQGANAWCASEDDRLRVGFGALVADGRALGLFLDENDGPAWRAASAALERGEVVVGDRDALATDGSVVLRVYEQSSAQDAKSVDHRLRGHLWTGRLTLSAPVLGERSVRALGLRTAYATVVTEMSGEADARAWARATTAADAEPDRPTVQMEYGPSDNTAGAWIALGLALLVGAIGTFSATALALAEGHADAATLAAVGASPRTRRLLAAGQSLVVAGLGSLLGLVAGLITGWAICRQMAGSRPGVAWYEVRSPGSGGREWTLDVPWLWILAVVVGLPVVVSLIVAAVTRSRLRLTRRIGQ
ncbi:MAG: ABC transporter permease [Kineosporiaceae bacterium]